MLAERLYIHCHDADEFRSLLGELKIEYEGPAYPTFTTTKGKYTFMSEEDYSFAEFMLSVPRFRQLQVLQRIVFDSLVMRTPADGWNYYGEPVARWRPDLVELIELAGIRILGAARKLAYDEPVGDSTSGEFQLDPFGDPFLDHIREEATRAHSGRLYLAVMFTARKLVEVISVRLLEVVFPKIENKVYSEANHDLWYDKRRASVRDLDTLLTVLDERADAFHEDRDLVREFVGLARPLKNETNACVHRDYKTPDEHYVASWSIPRTIRLGRRLFRKYCSP
jgi:hypothetical protein